MELSETDWSRIIKGMVNRTNETEVAASTGLYMGGDQHVERYLPSNIILNANVEEVIKAGVPALADKYIKIMDEHEVAARINNAVQQKKGFSLIRMGDGELLTLAQDAILSVDQVASIGSFLNYAGVKIPDLKARDALLETLLKADIVGIPVVRRPTYQNLFLQIAKYYNLPLKQIKFTSSVINYDLQNTDLYKKLFYNNKLLLIGNRMVALKKHLEKNGCNTIVSTIPVDGIKSVREVVKQAKRYNYDIAIVSGGVAATIICPLLSRTGKVAIDFGHLADELIIQNRGFN